MTQVPPSGGTVLHMLQEKLNIEEALTVDTLDSAAARAAGVFSLFFSVVI